MVHKKCQDNGVDSTSKNRLIMIGDVFYWKGMKLKRCSDKIDDQLERIVAKNEAVWRCVLVLTKYVFNQKYLEKT